MNKISKFTKQFFPVPRLWLQSAVFFLALALAISYLFLPGLAIASSSGGVAGAVYIAIAVAVCYIAASIYLKTAPRAVFSSAPERTFPESLKTLPILVAALAVLACVFAAVSALISLLVFYALASGLTVPDRNMPLAICVYALILLSLPFLAHAFAGFASGKTSVPGLLKSSIRMGVRAYIRLLAPCAVAYVLSLLARLLLAETGSLPGNIAALILASAFFGAAIPITWHIYASSAGIESPTMSEALGGRTPPDGEALRKGA